MGRGRTRGAHTGSTRLMEKPQEGRAGRTGGRQAHFPCARQTNWPHLYHREVMAAVGVTKRPAQAGKSTVFSVVLALAYRREG